jgi:hypothetical protein
MPELKRRNASRSRSQLMLRENSMETSRRSDNGGDQATQLNDEEE